MIENQGFKTSLGTPCPLGSNPLENGVNFAIYSKNAKSVFLCLFSEKEEEIACLEMLRNGKEIFSIFVEGLKSGVLYGYRIDGDFNPAEGLRFNKSKLLIDPYAKKLSGEIVRSLANFDYNHLDNANKMPKCIVTEDNFDWGKSKKPNIPFQDTIIYETHVKGMTKSNPEVAKSVKGKFLGLCTPQMIKYFKDLGITSVELLPIHSFKSENLLLRKGLTNYWGYNTLSYFALHHEYGTLEEFKTMVKTFHENGLEVIMDVVYNHTCEGNHQGPIYSFKGIDNPTYYTLNSKKEYYENPTGCGNSLNVANETVIQMIIDSLRYFASECQVDGFRFDLAATLTRNESKFIERLKEDDIISKVKLIAEPWDIGIYGYRLGKFQDNFCEWNDVFKKSIRAFWRGEENSVKFLANSLSGSEYIFKNHTNLAFSSINFITAHDGMTLEDLVSYNDKHNEANLEGNMDGSNDNRSRNYGIEGVTSDPAILKLREKAKRNMMCTLLISKGVPMILSGDEIGNSQFGNNNVYCQDNAIGWINWDTIKDKDKKFLDFTKKMITFRKNLDFLKNKNFFTAEDVFWYSCDGKEMTSSDWETSYIKCLGAWVSDLLFIFNASNEDISFKLENTISGEIILNTNNINSFTKKKIINQDSIKVLSQSIIVLRKK